MLPWIASMRLSAACSSPALAAALSDWKPGLGTCPWAGSNCCHGCGWWSRSCLSASSSWVLASACSGVMRGLPGARVARLRGTGVFTAALAGALRAVRATTFLAGAFAAVLRTVFLATFLLVTFLATLRADAVLRAGALRAVVFFTTFFATFVVGLFFATFFATFLVAVFFATTFFAAVLRAGVLRAAVLAVVFFRAVLATTFLADFFAAFLAVFFAGFFAVALRAVVLPAFLIAMPGTPGHRLGEVFGYHGR